MIHVPKALLPGPGSRVEVLGLGGQALKGQESTQLLLPKRQFVSLAEITRVSSAHSSFCLKGKDKECDELLLGMEVCLASRSSINEIWFLCLC